MPRRPRDEHLMRPAAPAMAAPEPHLAQEQVAMARIAQALVLHDPCHAAIAALDDDDVPLMEIASAELIGRKRVRLVTHHSTMTAKSKMAVGIRASPIAHLRCDP